MIQLTIIRIIFLLIVFGYAALKDYRHGEVSNNVWLYGLIGGPLAYIDLFLSMPNLWWLAVSSTVLTCAISLALFYFTNNFGGADTKALTVLAASFPLGGAFLFFPLGCFIIAGFIVGTKSVITKNREVRFLPYLCAGLIVNLLLLVV